MRLLYHCACAEGGLAEYALQQAAALAAKPNVEVLWQAPAALGVPANVHPVATLASCGIRKTNKTAHAVHYVCTTVQSIYDLAREAKRTKPDAVILATWHEYFAPLWASTLRALHRKGMRFGAVIHDPVRDYVLGPAWWHRWSVREAYSFLDVAFTHDSSAPDTCGSRRVFQVAQIPHGPYAVPESETNRVDLRHELGIPVDATVLLSFGHIRDGKNLDQAISALPSLPNVHLIVAGREQSMGQKQVGYYRTMAESICVAARCHFHTDYIPNANVWKYFRASDLLLLTYSQDFRSASGVLNVNAQFGLPVLASAGPSPLLEAVQKYGLGLILSQPSAEVIAEAVPRALGLRGDWARFRTENSWNRNAEIVAAALAQPARC